MKVIYLKRTEFHYSDLNHFLLEKIEFISLTLVSCVDFVPLVKEESDFIITNKENDIFEVSTR